MTRGLGTRRGLFGAIVSTALIAGCAPYRDAARPPGAASSPVVAPGAGVEPRAERGNPPFYDVLGKRYYVLSRAKAIARRGIASWYGREFHGLATSSGEPYDMHAMTAAHTTLPIPTWVEVTNLGNGQHVLVKVNDRGPFVNNRIIDLSYAAAQALDMVRNGTARVEVRALSSPPAGARATLASAAAEPPIPAQASATLAVDGPRTAAPAAAVLIDAAADTATTVQTSAQPTGQPSEELFVQVGAFAERDNALRLVKRLRSYGFVNSFVVTERDGGARCTACGSARSTTPGNSIG